MKISIALLVLACGPATAPAAPPSVGDPAELRMQYVHPDNEMAYFLIDDGDGRWIPTAQGVSLYPLTFMHSYRTPGEKARRWCSVSLSGTVSPWKPAPVVVSGEPLPEPPALSSLYSTSAAPEPSATFPGTVTGDSAYGKLWIAARFQKPLSLDTLALTPAADGSFPADFEIEITVDGGKHWLPVPSAQFRHFPNPGHAVVEIPLNGVVADGVRVISFRRMAGSTGKYTLALASLRAFGRDRAPFEASGPDPQLLAAWNNLWLTFGSAKNEIHEFFNPTWPTGRPYSGGMLAILATEWSLWNAMKMTWCGSDHLPALEQRLAATPVDESGYVWVTPTSEKHLEHSRHYAVAPIFISAVSYCYLMTRDKGFLEAKDPKTGETLLSKVRRAMRLLTDGLGGDSGLVTLTDPEVDGTPESKGNTYWDMWSFGYRDACMNTRFYQAVGYYADLLTALGDTTGAARFHSLRPVIREKFNATFWDSANGRYIGWIDKNGKRVDFGFVFINLEAVALGLATPDRAEKILQWIDGKRQVPGDTSTGADIYTYKIAPRSTTLAAESLGEGYCKSLEKVIPRAGLTGSWTTWEGNAQNGGLIFYVSYYDLHARREALGIGNALARMDVILDETAKDNLRRMPHDPAIGIACPFGILREFPESGLVPFFFVDGIMGLRPSAEGLTISPGLPPGWHSTTLHGFHFAGKTWTITVDPSAKEPAATPEPNGSTHITVPAEKTSLLTPEGKVSSSP